MHVHNHILGGPSSLCEATLFRQVRAGYPDCLDTLMTRQDGLVQAVVRRQVLGDLPFTEAVQAGRIGLWRAILGFDPARGLAFSTYAWPAIRHHIWRAVKAHSCSPASPMSEDGFPPLQAPDPAVVCEAAAIRQALCDLVQRLPERLRHVIMARYGLEGASPLTYRQIGATLGLSGERARQLHTEALVWLRHPAHSYTLHTLLGRHTLADYEAADALAQRWLRRRGGHQGA